MEFRIWGYTVSASGGGVEGMRAGLGLGDIGFGSGLGLGLWTSVGVLGDSDVLSAWSEDGSSVGTLNPKPQALNRTYIVQSEGSDRKGSRHLRNKGFMKSPI